MVLLCLCRLKCTCTVRALGLWGADSVVCTMVDITLEVMLPCCWLLAVVTAGDCSVYLASCTNVCLCNQIVKLLKYIKCEGRHFRGWSFHDKVEKDHVTINNS